MLIGYCIMIYTIYRKVTINPGFYKIYYYILQQYSVVPLYYDNFRIRGAAQSPIFLLGRDHHFKTMERQTFLGETLGVQNASGFY